MSDPIISGLVGGTIPPPIPIDGFGTSDLEDFEWEYNGLVFGGATHFPLVQVEGWDVPDYRIDETQKANDHGSFIFARYMDKRTITLTGTIEEQDIPSLEAKIQILKQTFLPRMDDMDIALRRKVPGDNVPHDVFCKPARVSFPITLDYNLARCDWVVQLLAGDPRIYSDNIQIIDLKPGVGDLGISFDVIFDIIFGGGDEGVAGLVNLGTIDTFPVVTIGGGQCDTILLISLTQDKRIELDLSLDISDVLVIDFQARTILLNGQTRYSALTDDSDWWTLQPGDNTIEFLVGSGEANPVRATVMYRSAWT